jgi:STE24 endopeptidase
VLANAAFNALARRRGAAWGIRGIDDYAGFPLLYAIGMVLIFLATPLFYKLTYTQEVEADLFAINATQNPDAWAEVALLTAEYRKLRPPQWEESWLNHHPSPYARVYMAMRWKAEQ